MIMFPVTNFHTGDLEPVYEVMQDPATIIGLGDGGAHCGQICDASMPTFMLTHWTRDRTAGEQVPAGVGGPPHLTSETADFFGFKDRGRLEPGQKADVNIIDYDALQDPATGGDLRLCPRAAGAWCNAPTAMTPPSAPACQSSRMVRRPVNCQASSSARDGRPKQWPSLQSSRITPKIAAGCSRASGGFFVTNRNCSGGGYPATGPGDHLPNHMGAFV